MKSGRFCFDAATGGEERRQFHQAREAFDYAYVLLAPFLDPETGWHGRSLHHVSFTLICENFPHLAHEEIHAMLVAVQRVFTEKMRAVSWLVTRPANPLSAFLA